MNKYVTGATIKELRERKGLTQAGLAEALTVRQGRVEVGNGEGLPRYHVAGASGTGVGRLHHGTDFGKRRGEHQRLGQHGALQVLCLPHLRQRDREHGRGVDELSWRGALAA